MPDCPCDRVQRVAHVAHEVLDELGAVGLAEDERRLGACTSTSGSSRSGASRTCAAAALAFAREVERRAPDDVTTTWWRKDRDPADLFVDYNQNARDHTIAAAYSVRGNPIGTVSTPIRWDEVDDVEPDDFTIAHRAGPLRRARRPARRHRRRGVLASTRCSSGPSATSARASPTPGEADDRRIGLIRLARAAPAALQWLLMPLMRIKDAARFLGVSDDTVRRWVDSGALDAQTGRQPAARSSTATPSRCSPATSHAPADDPSSVGRSARNRFVGLVTDIKRDTVMAQVELQCGPFRVVSLMSSEAVDDLGLELGLGRHRRREVHHRHRRDRPGQTRDGGCRLAGLALAALLRWPASRRAPAGERHGDRAPRPRRARGDAHRVRRCVAEEDVHRARRASSRPRTRGRR